MYTYRPSRRMGMVLAAMSATVVTISLAACSSGSPSSTGASGSGHVTSFQVAESGAAVTFLPMYVGVTENFYKKAGLNITFVNAGGGNTGMAAVESGKSQFYAGLPMSAIAAAAAGANVKMVSAIIAKAMYNIVASPNIHSLAQLKGQKVGMLVEGNGTEIWEEWLFNKIGIGYKNVTYVADGGIDTRLAALASGQISATILAAPDTQQAEASGFKDIANYSKYIEYPNQVLMALPSTLKDHASAVRAFLQATIEASNWIYSHPAKAYDIAVKWVQTPPTILKKALNLMIASRDFTTNGSIPLSKMSTLISIFKKYTTTPITSPLTAKSLTDLSYLPAK